MKYYAFIDGEQQGPFEPEKLISIGLRPSTYVWCKGLDDWKPASEVEEIRNLFRNHISDINSGRINPPGHAVPEDEPRQEPHSPAPDEPDLSDIPQSYRYYVRKSGEVPQPSNSLEPDLTRPPQVSMTLAVLSLFLCFIPTGIAAVYFTGKATKTWNKITNGMSSDEVKSLQQQSHEAARLAKMWLGITIAMGCIFWTLVFSVKN